VFMFISLSIIILIAAGVISFETKNQSK
jgi:hypothetical protein